MQIYHYDLNGVLLGLSTADTCPITGEPLIPAFATSLQPPDIPEGKQAVFVNGAWELTDISQNDSSVEPTAEEVRNFRLIRLNTEYAAEKAILRDAYVTADMRQDAELKTEIIAELGVLDADYADKLTLINAGQDPWEVV